MPGPVLGVDRIVLDGGVEPQAVALVTMVEGRLERVGGALAAAASPAAAASATAPSRLIRLVLVVLVGLGLRLGFGLGSFGGSIELGGDQGIILGPQVDLIIEIGS